MKRILTLIVLFICTSTFAQEVDMTKSAIFKDKKKNSILSFSLEDNKGGLITIRGYGGGFFGGRIKGYYIQHFDENLKIIEELDYKIDGNIIKNAFVKDEKLHLIEMINDNKKDIFSIDVKTSDINKLSFTSQNLLSFSEDKIKTSLFSIMGFTNGWNQVDGNHLGEVILSARNNFIVINFDIKNKKQETHKIYVFNSNFERVYEKLITRNIKDKLFKYNDITVDDENGTVYFLGKSYENNSRKSKKRNGEANYHFELIKVNKDITKVVSFKEPQRFIGSLTLLNEKNKITAIGFYGKKDEGRYNGVCVFDLDPSTLELRSKKFNDFSEKFMFDKYGNKTKRKKRKKAKGVSNIDFKSVFLMENGEIVLNAEEFFMITHTSMGPNGAMSTYTSYHYNDIISLRINADGTLKWSRNINKRQVGVFNTSFTALAIDGTSYYFINCSDKIKTSKAGQIIFGGTNSKKSNLYVISVDGNGKIGYKKLIDDKDSKVYYQVNDGVIDLGNQSVTLIGKKKKYTQVLKLKLK